MTSDGFADLLELLRPLRLPIELGREAEVAARAFAVISLPDEPLEETLDRAALMVDLHLDGEVHELLEPLVREVVEAGMPMTGGDDLAPRYTSVLSNLSEALLSRDLAIDLLSEAPLIYRLATQQGMSATQISLVLTQLLGGTFFPYDAVRTVMRVLRVRPEIDPTGASALLEADIEATHRRFGDASLAEAASIMGDTGRRLGFPSDLEGHLRWLCPPELTSRTFVPYLQALDFICVVAESYDHPPQFLYEFAPRGQVANQIFDRYPLALAPTGNPILNNFKAVEAADRAWSRSRPSPMSHALVSVLEGLSKMPFLARRDLAAWIRQWLVRVVALLDSAPLLLLDETSVGELEVSRLLDWTAAGNTATGGLIEQRVVDALTSAIHSPSDGWRPRGIGDATTVSNLSRKKVGDVEFQNVADRTVIAYEPHGGRLSSAYLDGHLRSVRRVIALRAEEWRGIADLSAWSIEVRFLAHSFTGDLQVPPPAKIEAVGVATTTQDFASFIASAMSTLPPAEVEAAVRSHVFVALNRREVAQEVRLLVSERCGVSLIESTVDDL
jgi:hypothetical protein